MRKFYLGIFVHFLFAISAAAQTGMIKVKVVDEQNMNLPGASLMIDGAQFSAVTNAEGVATIVALPKGTHTLTISYIGYSTFQQTITTSDDLIEIKARLQSGVPLLKGVLVMGDRLKGQAKALNQQKASGNIINIISADQMGRFPDANIGDAIKRVPGVTMQNDQGEARNIIVRGMGPEFNAVTLNGERIPSAEGDNRRVQMDLIPADMVQTVEVSKTLTPDMDADAIGGSVNLITRSAPNGLRISATAAGGYNSVRNGFIGTGNLIVGNRLFKNKLGFIINGSFNSNDYGSDNIEAVWSKDAAGKPFVSDHDMRVYDIIRVRRSAGISLDYKINPLHTIYLSGMYNWRDDKESRFRLRHRYRGDEEDYANDLIYDAGGNIIGYSNGEVLRQTKGGLNNDRNDARRLEDQRVRTLALRGAHQWGKLKTGWNVQYARASEKRPNERYIAMGLRDINVLHDITNPERPLLTDAAALTDYTRLDELTEQFQNQYEEDINAKLDFEWPLAWVAGQKGSLMFGGRIRSKQKVRENNFYSYEPLDDNEAAFANISLLPLVNKTSTSFYPGAQYVAGQFISPALLGSLNFKNADLFEESDEPSEYLAGNYKAKEQITAGYIAFKQNFTNALSATIGVRIEHTAIDYTGNIVEDEETLKGQAQLKNNYTDVLPSINLRYAATDNFIVKAAWTSSVARPRYYDLVPYFNVLPGDQELSAGNPTLDAVRSKNLDLIGEYYFKTVGIVSGGLFYKKLDNFFYTYVDNNFTTEKFAAAFPDVTNPIADGESWDFSQRRNGNGAKVWGVEAAFQRQLDFLPGLLKGLGVYLNYTYTHSKADAGILARNDVKLPGAAPHIFNASLSYETKKLVARVSGNFTSAYVDDSDDAGYNEDAFFDRYYDKQFFLDANASYAVLPSLRIFAEANNLTNQPLRYYQGIKERTAQLEYYGPRYNLGVKFDLTK